VFLTKYYFGDHIMEVEMGNRCDTYGKNRNAHVVFVGKPGGGGEESTFKTEL
jgi:hypothetical protein